jgi:hypothetical protein
MSAAKTSTLEVVKFSLTSITVSDEVLDAIEVRVDTLRCYALRL